MKTKVCFVVSNAMTVNAFLLEPIIKLSKFYEIYILLNLDSKESLPSLEGVAKVLPVNIQRKIRLKSDLAALWQLFKLFRHHNFQVVHSVTPKAGLLAMLAAYAARVPLRIHTFTGQVWVTKFGLKRFLLKRFDCFIAFLTTHNIVDSPSQHQFLVDEKVMTSAKSVVYAKGSISGVDVVRFKPNVLARENIRQQLNIPNDAIVFLFLGRLTRDKGVLNLALAFSYLQNGGAHLLFVGPDEQSMQTEIMQITRLYGDSVHFVEHTNVPESYMAAADVLCLPSYREGFGSVVIEAAAVGVPAIASRIYGISDAIVEGETGLMHAPHDVHAIKICMENIMNNPTLRLKLGEQARMRAIRDFDSNLIMQEWLNFYRENLH